MIYRIFITLSIWVMKLIIRFAALRNAEFRDQWRGTRFSFNITIGGTTQHYGVTNGKWRSIKNRTEAPDLEIQWRDAGAASRCLMHVDIAEIIKAHASALTDGRLTVEANLAACHNFGMLLNKLAEAI